MRAGKAMLATVEVPVNATHWFLVNGEFGEGSHRRRQQRPWRASGLTEHLADKHLRGDAVRRAPVKAAKLTRERQRPGRRVDKGERGADLTSGVAVTTGCHGRGTARCRGVVRPVRVSPDAQGSGKSARRRGGTRRLTQCGERRRRRSWCR